MILRKAHYQFYDKYRGRSRKRNGEKSAFEQSEYYRDNHTDERGVKA